MNGFSIAFVAAGLAVSACSSPPANQLGGTSQRTTDRSNSSSVSLARRSSSSAATSSAALGSSSGGTASAGATTGGTGSTSGGGSHSLAFQPAVPYTVQSKPFAVAVADFNGDGALDLAVANNGSGTVSLLLGHGTGTFSATFEPATVGGAPQWVAAADLNGDGISDLAIANASENSVQVILGSPSAGFSSPATYAAQTATNGLAIGDFNGEGVLDLVTSNYGSSAVSVFLGKGDGTFEPAESIPTGPSPIFVAGLPGGVFAVAIQSTNSVETLKGQSDGGWSASLSYAAGTMPTSIATGDLNHDGLLDLAVTDWGGGVDVLLGAAAGGFAAPSSFTVGTNPNSVAIADFNGDGNLDLAVANANGFAASPGVVSVLLGAGDGAFGYATTFAVGEAPVAVATADFNRDGCPVLVVANDADGTVSVLLCTP